MNRSHLHFRLPKECYFAFNFLFAIQLSVCAQQKAKTTLKVKLPDIVAPVTNAPPNSSLDPTDPQPCLLCQDNGFERFSNWLQSGRSVFLCETKLRLGLGTSNPLSRLHIAGNSQTEAAGSRGLRLTYGTGHNCQTLMFEYGDDNDSYIGSLSPISFHIRTSSVPRISISDDGKVGINNQAYNSDFAVKGSTVLGDPEGPMGGSIPENNTLVTDRLAIAVSDYNNQLNVGGNASIGTSAAAPANGLLVEGNVGIGTVTPAEKLDVNGNIKATGLHLQNTGLTNQVFTINNNGASAWVNRNTFASLSTTTTLNAIPKFDANGTLVDSRISDDAGMANVITIAANTHVQGKVELKRGIPTGAGYAENPLLRLSNDYNLDETQLTEVTATLDNGALNQTGWKLGAGVTGSNFFRIQSIVSGIATERFRISNNGNIGMGITNPESRLSISQLSPDIEKNEIIRLSNTHNYTPEALNEPTIVFDNKALPNTTNHYGWKVGSKVLAGLGFFRISRRYGMEGDMEFFRINNEGNVGIGTSNPQSRFAVCQLGPTNGNKNELMRLSNDFNNDQFASNEPTIVFDNKNAPGASNHYAWKIGAQVAGPGYFRISKIYGIGNDLEFLRINANGNVGIGTIPLTDNYAKLQVKGSIVIEDNSQLDETYNLRIGKFQPSLASGHRDARLFCDGKGLFKSLIVYNPSDWVSWPDYVFDEHYDLLSLSETEKYIKAENHLPGVPTEKQVNEKGVDLLEMNKILLQKVEELTLHLIRLQKDVESLNIQK